MPKEIVKESGFRNIYTDYFMIPTLQNFRQNLVVQAFNEQGYGFLDRYIIVNLNAEPHPDILAATIKMRGSENQVETCIVVSDTLAKLPKQEQKMCLAHEWIHAMMTFREESRNDIHSEKLSDQSETALYGYLLTSNSFWQDDEQSSREIREALNRLLASDELVSKVLHKDFKIDIRQLWEASNIQDNILNTIDLVSDFARIFSSRYYVPPEIATKRLIEMIFEDKEDASFLSLKKEFWLSL